MQWVPPEENKEQPEQESDALTIAYMAGFHAGKNKDAPQPEPNQEPVAWRSWNDKDKFGFWDTKAEAESWCDLDFDSEPLYTAPSQRKWVGLTGPEVVEAYRSVSEKEWAIGGLDDARVFFCAIEAKLREKNGG